MIQYKSRRQTPEEKGTAMAKSDQTTKQELTDKFYKACKADIDIADRAEGWAEQFRELLDVCDVRPATEATPSERRNSPQIISHFLTFRAGEALGIGGSCCDYATYAALDATDGYTVSFDGSEAAKCIMGEIAEATKATAVYPNEMLAEQRAVGIVA